MTSYFVDPVVIAEIEQSNVTLQQQIQKVIPCVDTICDYASSLPAASVPEAPIDGKLYGRKDAAWEEVVSGGGNDAVWGQITGVLSEQVDLQAALDTKLPSSSYTNADVKTKYEANADTNAFTDSEKTKLQSVEQGAQVNTLNSIVAGTNVTVDVTDPLNPVISATGGGTGGDSVWGQITGELSDQTDLQNSLDGKLDTASYTAADVKSKYESNADTNVFTDAEKTKLEDIANARWTSTETYTTGSRVIASDNQQYVSVQNNININPSTDTDWSHWKPVWALTQVENRLKRNQNWNIPGRTGHPLPDATPRNYPSGAEIALGVFVRSTGGGLISQMTKVGEVVSAESGRYYARLKGNITDFAGIKLDDGRIIKAKAISTSGVEVVYQSSTEIDILVDFAAIASIHGIPRGAHKFVGCSELPGVWPDVSDEESSGGSSVKPDISLVTNDHRINLVENRAVADDWYFPTSLAAWANIPTDVCFKIVPTGTGVGSASAAYLLPLQSADKNKAAWEAQGFKNGDVFRLSYLYSSVAWARFSISNAINSQFPTNNATNIIFANLKKTLTGAPIANGDFVTMTFTLAFYTDGNASLDLTSIFVSE